MPVHPQVQQLLDALAALQSPPLQDQTVEQARESMRALSAMGEPCEVGSVDDRAVPGPAGDIPVRVYRPVADGTPPILVWLHGGGWVIGDLDTADGTARELCRRVGALVVSVDYRLAPEHPFPAAVEDCVAATRWVAANGGELGGDPTRLAVGGDSAGGNLAAVVCRHVEEPIAFQLLVYPVTDCTFDHPSHTENAEGYLLTRDGMVWFRQHYLGDGDRTHPDASPLHASDLTGLPPALVLTAEFDPLRDEGEAYAKALDAAGVDVELIRYDGMIHGFFAMHSVVDAAGEALDVAADRLRRSLT